MANINETFRFIEFSDPKKFTQSPEGRVELKRYSDDLVFYSSFDSTAKAVFGKGALSPTLSGTVTNNNDGKFGQHIRIQNGNVKYDKSNFYELKEEGSISFYAKTDFNNAPGEQSFQRKQNPIITTLPTLSKKEFKFGGGSLDLRGDEEKRIEYDIRNISSLAQVGTIDFFVKTNYDGTPTKNVSFVDINNGTNNNNKILISHETDGSFHFRIYDQSGSLEIHISFSWSANKNNWINVSLNFDLNNGVTRVFIDGNQYGPTNSNTATRQSLTTGYVGIGSSTDYISNFYLDDLAIFNQVRFVENYNVRQDTFSDSIAELVLLARYNLNLNLQKGEFPEISSSFPITSDYRFRLSVDGSDFNGDISVSLATEDTMTSVMNKIASALSSANVTVFQEPEGNITIRSNQNGAYIEIFSPAMGRDLLQILDGVFDSRLPNGPLTDTIIFDLYNENNNNNRISFVHTTESHIVIKMWDGSSKLVVEQDCGEWTNWSHFWYKLELNWSESIAQFFIDGEMKSVFVTNFERNYDNNSLFLRSHETNSYRFDELIIFNSYKNKKTYQLETMPLSPYDADNPYIDIHFGNGFKEDEVVGINLDSSVNIHFAIKIGQTWYYYLAGAWRVSDGSFSQTNGPSTIETKFHELFFDENIDLVMRAYFSSNGQNIEWIDNISIIIESDTDLSAIIIGSVILKNSVDLSSDQHITITTNRQSKEIDLVSQVEGLSAEVIGNQNLFSGFDWNENPSSFSINDTTITLDVLTTSLEEVINVIESQLPNGIEVFSENNFIGFRTTEKSSAALIDIEGDALNELGINEDAYTGSDPDYSSVSSDDIIAAINEANVDGLNLAVLDSFGRIVLSSKDKGETALISISEGSTSNALDIVWGFASSDSGETSAGPFIDYTIIKDWIREQLGAPIAPVELTDEQIENCISLAAYWYNYYRNSKENKIYVQLEGDPDIGYKIPKEVGDEQDILEIIVKPRFPFAYYTGGDVDGIMSNIYMQWMFQRGRHAGFNDFLGDYYITLSAEKDYSIILGTETRWRFYNGRLFINPAPIGMNIIIVFKSALTIEEVNTNALVREYALGEAKKILGTIRSTFGGQIPGGAENLTLNGDSLKLEGQQEVDKAFEKMQSLMEPFGFDFG